MVRSEHIHGFAGQQIGFLPGKDIAPIHGDHQADAPGGAVVHPDPVVAMPFGFQIGAQLATLGVVREVVTGEDAAVVGDDLDTDPVYHDAFRGRRCNTRRSAN